MRRTLTSVFEQQKADAAAQKSLEVYKHGVDIELLKREIANLRDRVVLLEETTYTHRAK